MSLFVDTSAWSLAFRRDSPPDAPEVVRLREALVGGETLFSTGLVLQELLQGFAGPRAQHRLVERFAALPLLVPERADHVAAASLRNDCRRAGIQVGTIDGILAALCLRFGLVLLTTDRDFRRIGALRPLRIWGPPA